MTETVQIEATNERNPHYQPRRVRWDTVAVRGIPAGYVARVTFDGFGTLEIDLSNDPTRTFDPAVGDKVIGEGEAFQVENRERIDPEWAARLLFDAYRRELDASAFDGGLKTWDSIPALHRDALIAAVRWELDEVLTAAKQRQRELSERINRALGAFAEALPA